MQRIFLLVLCLFFTATALVAQQPTVKMYVQQVSKGWTTDAKQALPDLLLDKPDDAGVMFLHASLVDDPARAMPLLEKIIKNHPSSEWADDAMLRIILFNCFKNNGAKAKEQFVAMRKAYPKSELLPAAHDALRMSVGSPPPANVKGAEKPAKETKAAKADKEEKPAKAAVPAQRVYTLNTKVVPSKETALAMLDSFKKKRLRAQLAEKWVSGKRNYVVQVGEYETEVDAARDIELVRGICKCKPTVVKRD